MFARGDVPFLVAHLVRVVALCYQVGITGKYGTRYGASLRKRLRKMEVTQHAKFNCAFCGKDSVKRQATGIWNCGSCRKQVAGGAYTLAYVDAAALCTILCHVVVLSLLVVVLPWAERAAGLPWHKWQLLRTRLLTLLRCFLCLQHPRRRHRALQHLAPAQGPRGRLSNSCATYVQSTKFSRPCSVPSRSAAVAGHRLRVTSAATRCG